MSKLIAAGIDTETTGLLASDHRIIEIHIALWRNGSKFWEYDQRIDPQRAISVEAQRVHGITSADLIGKPTWDVVGPQVYKVLTKADYYVWHNGNEFDGPFIDMELQRIGLALPVKPSVDTMLNGVWATPDGKKPRLGELCFACGTPYDESLAHGADYDVDVMMQSYLRGCAWGFFKEPACGSLSAVA